MLKPACGVFLLLTLLASPLSPQQKKRRILAIGDVHRKIYQHDAVSHALATIERLGYQSGIYDTYIRTDIQLITKHLIRFAENTVVPDANQRSENYKDLNDFDAIVFYGIGELELTDQQKADMLSFIKDDGKGFVGIHTAVTSFYTWPEYGEMIGGYFDEHPWGTFNAPIIVEDPAFPGMKQWPRSFDFTDEIYQLKDYSREKLRVLMRLDAGKLDLNNPRVHRTDKDFAVTWAKMYGKGRVYYSTLGHREESWDRPEVREMYTEAIKWAMGLVDADVTARPAP